MIRHILFGAVAALILAELVLRFALGLGDPPLVERDPEIEYLLAPDRAYRRFGNDIAVNRLRMRSEDFPAEKPPGEIRVILVGDSVVYGNHRLSQGETIGYGLKSALQPASRCPVTVGAIAASSWGPVNQRAFIARYGLFGADAVVFVQSSHDLADTPGPGGEVIPYRRRAPVGAVGDFAEIIAERLSRRLAPARPSAPYAERVARSLAAFDDMLTRAAAANAEPVFFFHPTRGELVADGAQAEAAFAEFARLAAARGASVIDGRAVYAAAGGARVHADDIHPGAEGAMTISSALARALAPIVTARCP